MAPHSSTLAWKIPWAEEPDSCSPWGRWGSDTTERLHFHFHALEKEMATHSSVLAWRIPAVYGVAQSRTRLKWLSSSSSRVMDTENRRLLEEGDWDWQIHTILYGKRILRRVDLCIHITDPHIPTNTPLYILDEHVIGKNECDFTLDLFLSKRWLNCK